MSADPHCLNDPAYADFLTTGVSISVGSRDGDHLPNLTRGVGCDVSGDRSTVRVFVIAEQSRELLDDVRANHHVAAVFSQPGSHRALQLKGSDAVIESLVAGDARIVERYREAFADTLDGFGYSRLFAGALLGRGGDLVAVKFTPTAVSLQAPGAKAGSLPEDGR